MDTRLGQLQPMKTLIIDDEMDAPTADGRALRNLVTELNKLDIEVVQSRDYKDGESAIVSDPSIDCVLVDWDLDKDKREAKRQTLALLKLIRAHNEKMSVFLITEHSELSNIPLEIIEKVDDFILILEDTADFIAGRICASIRRYRDQLLPPFFAALVKFAQTYEYSWHTPGHTGGVAFLKSPVGQAFFNFFGENMLRSDLSISVGELGSLLDHSGPIGDGERYAARVFGAHRTYSVTNGTSTSNRIVFTASVTQDDIVLCDRNCHKSIEHSLTMTGALPAYLIPSRNRYGIIGPIHPDILTPASIKSLIKNNPLTRSSAQQKPVHSVITNSTYDGLCYNVRHVAELLGQSVDRIHFDEAWYGYARFNPIYRERYAMHGDPAKYKGPTLFATQSTHKLLAALSQASFIHVRDGRNPIEHERFNEAFMMHSSTSPQYAIIASNDVAAGMMDGVAGHTLTAESIKEAVAFRKTMARLRKELAGKEGWFFGVWQPEEVYDGKSKKRVPFEEAPDHLLCSEPNCWVLHPVDKWHGFADLQNSYCMLDPIKVTVITPGVASDGSLEKFAIPAMLVTAYLDRQGIVVEKTGDFSVLFLFSMGVTKGKWGTLITALLDFKKDYDANRPLAEVLPSLVQDHPGRYDGMGLKDLSDEMMDQIRKGNNTQLLSTAFSQLPQPKMTPQKAYRYLVRDQVEQVALDRIANRIVATGIVPYPPGIPMLMPGENIGGSNSPFLSYLKALQAFDARFPGFGHDIHGVENVDGRYMIYCVKEVSNR
jgi:arginine decarboxylase